MITDIPAVHQEEVDAETVQERAEVVALQDSRGAVGDHPWVAVVHLDKSSEEVADHRRDLHSTVEVVLLHYRTVTAHPRRPSWEEEDHHPHHRYHYHQIHLLESLVRGVVLLDFESQVEDPVPWAPVAVE